MKRIVTLLILITSLVLSFHTSNATEVSDTTYIFLKDYGLQKTKKQNCVKYINKALEDLKGDKPTVLVFTRGIYHFYPDDCQTREYYESNTTDINPKVCAFLFEEKKNLVIDGRGSTLIFHGQMQPFTFDNCSNITLKNINIDWENPLIAQGEVLKVTDDFIDLGINHKEFPHLLDNNKLVFDVYNSKPNSWRGTMEFDRKGRYVVPQTGDWGCLGRGWENYVAETTMPGVVRLHYKFTRKPKPGNYLVLRHAERTHSGIFILKSKKITIQNLNLYHATGLGVLAQFSEDLTFNGYRAIPNRAKNHYFGGGDDGLQVSNCRGQITVTNCEFEGLMDDPINVHGTSVQVQEILSKKEVKCKFMHHQSIGLNWGHKDDKISFIENERMNSLGTGNVISFKPIDKEYFTLTFSENIPNNLETGDALENLTWSPYFTVNNTHFKSCRARGLLISTPGKVVVENNIFESSGSAILIAGDANGWFESGAVADILIKNNTFTELCNTSSYQFCEAIISIFPIIPTLDEKTPAFHKNIRIEGNQFNPFDYPVLFARSVDGIEFTNNTVTRSHTFEPYHNKQFTFTFENCKNTSIRGNQFSEDLLGKNILLKKTKITDLQTDVNETFQIQEF
ncbi:right-handed parallel beta-helix repeat-containing protein [Prolixibacteraceae bacterium Z1-6]|uniref:Right-handed parallel beta-helix repeat-containing protein n=1 Tax=Draconibacterium aestuarii TaxID=2998507 RepID=A0A9X3F425_9BACT|nr:right-handed parallel beta-helix repeat-containing protein [Prolixibacteraceae bacterium Z1-6]